MIQNPEKQGIRVKRRINFLKEKETVLPQYPGYLGDALLPVFQMMDNSEIKNGIKTAIGKRQFLGVGGQADATARFSRMPASFLHFSACPHRYPGHEWRSGQRTG